MDRITQLRIEQKLAEALVALPLSTRVIINTWYANAINDVETGKAPNTVVDDDLDATMEAINDAVKNIR